MPHRNVVNGQTKTWPYGTRKTVTVEQLILGQAAIAVEAATREGWVILGVDLSGVKVGQEREIVFREGGPLGGFWEFSGSGPTGCTGVAARWCPVCGDCGCREELDHNDPECPLHAPSSPHAETPGVDW